MAIKSEILILVNKLLKSAKSRGTEQGVIVYQLIIEELAGETSSDKVVDSLKSLNRSLAGIEAHGHYTDSEFELVQELRSIENDAERIK